MAHPTRRGVLVTASAALAGLAGCTGTPGASGDSTETTRSVTESTTDRPTETAPAGTDGNGTDAADATDATDPATTTTETTAESTATSARTNLTFEGSDGRTVEATRYGTGDCGVVLVPQVNLDRRSWAPQARRLADEGFLALAIDEGESRKDAGVLGAVEYLRTAAGVDHVVLVGASTGGEASVVAAARASPPVAGVVGLSAAGGTDAVADVDAPSLFVVGSEDETRFVETARTLTHRAPDPTAFLTYETSAHGQSLFDSNGDDLFGRLATFAREACAGEAETEPTAG